MLFLSAGQFAVIHNETGHERLWVQLCCGCEGPNCRGETPFGLVISAKKNQEIKSAGAVSEFTNIFFTQYINDLGKDKRYKNWPGSVQDILRPTFPGMLRHLAVNFFHLVCKTKQSGKQQLKQIEMLPWFVHLGSRKLLKFTQLVMKLTLCCCCSLFFLDFFVRCILWIRPTQASGTSSRWRKRFMFTTPPSGRTNEHTFLRFGHLQHETIGYM